MPRGKAKEPEIINVPDKDMIRKSRPAADPVSRERRLVALATDLAEKQLIEGTAAPSTINFYLKIGSTREFLEREILEKQRELIEAKVGSIESSKDAKMLYENAVEAMKNYSGSTE